MSYEQYPPDATGVPYQQQPYPANQEVWRDYPPAVTAATTPGEQLPPQPTAHSYTAQYERSYLPSAGSEYPLHEPAPKKSLSSLYIAGIIAVVLVVGIVAALVGIILYQENTTTAEKSPATQRSEITSAANCTPQRKAALTTRSNILLFYAAQFGQNDDIRMLLDCGANIDAKNSIGISPLTQASLFGHADTALLLINRGAQVNPTTHPRSTPLIAAASNGYTEITQLLLDHGANPELKNGAGLTALFFAARYGRTGITQLLLDHGANPEVKNSAGQTALMLAIGFDHTGTVRVLLDHGVNIEAKNNLGQTALIMATGYGYIDIVRLLLKHGADVNSKDNYGFTALDYCKDTNIRELLRSYGAVSGR